MVRIKEISRRFEDYSSSEEYDNAYQASISESYEHFTENGHSWCWCLVGNIVQNHEFGEEHEIKYGTKQFSRGTKIFLAPAQWGDGYEKIVVIGLSRYKKKYIEVVTRSKYVENLRIQKVYKPAILTRMCSSGYRWWGDTESDKNEILGYLKTFSK